MTRSEFMETVTTWQELIDFCCDNGLSICDNIYSDGSRDDYINECIMDWAREDTWQELRDALSNLDEGYDYWIQDDYGDWIGTDDGDNHFEDYFNETVEYMDRNEEWDPEEDEDEPDLQDEPDQEEQEPEVTDEDFCTAELFAASQSCIRTISEQELNAAREADQAFATLISTEL